MWKIGPTSTHQVLCTEMWQFSSMNLQYHCIFTESILENQYMPTYYSSVDVHRPVYICLDMVQVPSGTSYMYVIYIGNKVDYNTLHE